MLFADVAETFGHLVLGVLLLSGIAGFLFRRTVERNDPGSKVRDAARSALIDWITKKR
jgi:hypothetical protein